MEQKNIVEQKAILNVHDLQELGFTRTMAYQLLGRKDMPVVVIGGRKFMHRDLFMKWLEEQAASEGA